MKTIKKMSLVALMFISTIGYAERRNVLTFSKVAIVEFVNAKKGHQLFVKDEYGIILHSETIKTSGDLSKALNLKQLKDGKYTVELEKDFEIIIKPFEIKNNVLVFFKTNETKIFKPVVRQENRKLLVSQLSLKSEPVEVEIFFEDDLIYSETITGEKNINRIYKLQDETYGNYHAIIKIDNRSYIEYFKF